MIAFLVLCFTASVGNTTEKTNFNEKINNWFINEKVKIVDYQKKNWQEGKDQVARTIESIKSLFVKN